jgi:hypothetical protein
MTPGTRARISPATLTAVTALALAAIVFGRHLHGEFVWDDYYLVEKNPLLASPSGWRALLTTDLWEGAGFEGSRLYHPLPMLSLWAQVRLTGLSIVSLRSVNVGIHGLNVWLFYRLLARSSFQPVVASATSLLFAVHPLVVEPAMWLTGRHDSMAVLLGLAGLHAVPALATRNARAGALACAATAGCAFASKEPYIALPALYGGYAILIARMPLGRALAGAAAGGAGVGAVLLIRWHLGITTVGDLPAMTIGDRIRTYGTLVGVYGGDALSLSAGPTLRAYAPWKSSFSLLATLTVAALLAAGLQRWRRGSVVGARVAFGSLWFALSLMPHVVTIATLGVFANRYGYFPLLGVLFAAAALIDRLFAVASVSLRRILAIALFCPAAICVPVSSAMASLWTSEIDLFGADFAQDPDDPQVLYFLGCAIERKAGCEAALTYFRKSAELGPKLARASQNLAGCLLRTGKGADAVTPAENAARLAPSEANLYNLALALEAAGRIDDAVPIAETLRHAFPTEASFAELFARLKEERPANDRAPVSHEVQ